MDPAWKLERVVFGWHMPPRSIPYSAHLTPAGVGVFLNLKSPGSHLGSEKFGRLVWKNTSTHNLI